MKATVTSNNLTVKPAARQTSVRIGKAAAMAAMLLGVNMAQANTAMYESLPQWELGLAGVSISQPAYLGSKQRVSQTLVVPSGAYRSPRVDVDKGVLVKALKTQNTELNIDADASLGAKSEEASKRAGMPNLGFVLEVGPRLKVNLGETAGVQWTAQLPVRSSWDLTELAFAGVTVEPSLSAKWSSPKGKVRLSTSVSALYADARKNAYTYSVSPEFATAARPAFEAEAGLVSWRVNQSISTSIGNNARMFAFVRYDDLSQSANIDSPLVETKHGLAYGAGFRYTWLRSKAQVLREK